MEDVLVLDNVIPRRQSEYILDSVCTDNFPWFFMPKIVDPNGDQTSGNVSGFNHFLLEENKKVSEYFDMFYPIVLSALDKSKISTNHIVRMRLNFHSSNPDSKLEYHLPHIDSFFPHYNLIYYLNDSDGDTFIFNETNDTFDINKDQKIVTDNNFTIKTRISPKQGRCIIFNGKYYHSSSYPRKSIFRSVMNVNLSTITL